MYYTNNRKPKNKRGKNPRNFYCQLITLKDGSIKRIVHQATKSRG